MIDLNEYDKYDGIGLAELVKKKEVKPLELVEAAIQRIELHNPTINAVIHKMYEEGRRVAQTNLPKGIFEGVPFLLKDLLVTYAGSPYSRGCKAFKNNISPTDNELMRRYKATGLVTIGKTNTPEFGLLGYTEPEAFGATSTPWNKSHTSGGSSGGSAAAVAAGFSPIASGGDGGGSIRIPASCCGIFGLKPTRGRTPTAPKGENWQGAAIQHILSRSVRDSAAMLDAIQGSAPGAPYVIQSPQQPYLEAMKTAVRPLKIAFTTTSPINKPVHPDCIQAVKETAKLLESLGHTVVETKPEYDGMELAMSYLVMYFSEIAVTLREMERTLGRKITNKDVEEVTLTLGLLGRTLKIYELVEAKNVWHKVGRIMGQFHQTYDLLLTPTMATPPAKIGELKPNKKEMRLMKIVNTFGLGKTLYKSGMVEQIATENIRRLPFTQLANLTGQPAMSVPLHWSENGLPNGVQFIAPYGDETTLFQLAAQLEQVKPWFNKRPPMIKIS